MRAHLEIDALRVACDLMNLYFVIDEHTDVDDGQVTEKKINIVKDALRNPSTPRPKGEWIGGEITRQLVVIKLCPDRSRLTVSCIDFGSTR